MAAWGQAALTYPWAFESRARCPQCAEWEGRPPGRSEEKSHPGRVSLWLDHLADPLEAVPPIFLCVSVVSSVTEWQREHDRDMRPRGTILTFPFPFLIHPFEG